ncbi:MAG: hypothetical protein WCQ00_03040 [bacterium]
MIKQISKTDFILYRECPNNTWVKIHNPEKYAEFPVSDFEKSLAVMGNEVELLARGMFPEGIMVEGRGEESQKQTKKLIDEHTPVIIQAVLATDKYLAATDILVWNEDVQYYDLYEVKMSSTFEKEEGGLNLMMKMMRIMKKKKNQRLIKRRNYNMNTMSRFRQMYLKNVGFI